MSFARIQQIDTKNFFLLLDFLRVEVYLLYEVYHIRTLYQPQRTIITDKNHKTMKRIYRNDMSQSQKDKLSLANQGKTLSQSTKDKISQALAKYWNSLPYKPLTLLTGDTSTGR